MFISVLVIAVLLGLLFYFVNKLLSDKYKCDSNWVLILMAVFVVAVFLLLAIFQLFEYPEYRLYAGALLSHSLVLGLVYFLVSSKDVYKLTDKLIGGLAGADGCPTHKGCWVHAIIYAVLLMIFRYLPY
jgi:TctA family transporter